MNTMPTSADVAPAGNYEATRFNALRHGVLSRYAVLPWEDEGEYQVLLGALVAEHSPEGPTEEHLVEELAGIIWRKRRLRLAEAAIFREKLRKASTSTSDPAQIGGAALLPITGQHAVKVDIPRALATTAADTARDLRDVKRDESMTRRALNMLAAGGPDVYARSLAALREDTRTYWLECLEDPPADGLTYEPIAAALEAWLHRHRPPGPKAGAGPGNADSTARPSAWGGTRLRGSLFGKSGRAAPGKTCRSDAKCPARMA
jgi:hypothetical protein